MRLLWAVGFISTVWAGTFDQDPNFQSLLKKLPKGVSAGIYVEALGKSGGWLANNAEKNFVPASTMKLVTTQVAFAQMGSDAEVETKVYQSGDSLIIEGGGDPYLVSERLWLIARDVARTGIKHINGIKISNQFYSKEYSGLTNWSGSGEPFAAYVDATSVNFNSLELHVWYDKKSQTVKAEAGPLPISYSIINNSVKATGGTGSDLTLSSGKLVGNKQEFALSGKIGRNADPVIIYTTVDNTPAYVASLFAAVFRDEGIVVDQDYLGPATASDVSTATLILSSPSLKLQDLARLYNTFSNNFMAESTFQLLGASAMGAPASIEKSRQTMGDYFQKRGLCSGSVIDNGSGLSWDTRLSPKCFVDLLQDSYKNFKEFPDLLASLPIGGATGTLKNRFKHVHFDAAKVRAKTGTLWSEKAVTTLVGFVPNVSGDVLVFAILLNGDQGGRALLPGMRDWEDNLVDYLYSLRAVK